VLQLQPIARAVRQAVNAKDAHPAPLTSSLCVCVAVGVLQRWSASSLARSPQQRRALQAALLSLKLSHATTIVVHDELITPSGALLERTSGTTTPVLLHLRDECEAELFLTSAAVPRGFVQELVKLLQEPAQRAEAAMAMLPLLEVVWSWDGVPADMLQAAMCGSDYGLGDLPKISPDDLWLCWDASARIEPVGAEALALEESSSTTGSEDDLHSAMVREQELLGLSGEVVDASVFEGGVVELDPALAATLSSIQEMRSSKRPSTGGYNPGGHLAGSGPSVGDGSRVSEHTDTDEGGHGGGSGGSGGVGGSGGTESVGSINRGARDVESVGAAAEFPDRVNVDAWEALDVQPAVVEGLLSSSSAEQQSTGRWGEKFVASLLRTTLASAEVTWVNEEEERGLPYDILISERMASSGWCRESFVEVKATTSADKALFQMSVEELEFARKQGAAYSLYRVFSACGAGGDVRVHKLHNVARSLEDGGLVLFAGRAGALGA